MTSEVKLLTEAEARGAWQATYSTHAMSITDYFAQLRERGLIAPEPVDPLDAVWEVYGRIPGSAAHCTPREKTKAFRDALREVGMELRPPLTREMVREAAHSAIRICDTLLGLEDFHSDASQHDKDNLNGFLDRLHAALTDGGRDG